ncbi:hypothetical protein Nepgr_018152 [Nepenthes gracilis]|uniref:Pentatricopeptide repeat-containing protein n=1 Tax=Nepenthes gracilis TaxID=150966 RepID=A0AAD3SU76_NEPGR|nr:hypothetical protein Nepgr_018152 [Nepenthes gracilis]
MSMEMELRCFSSTEGFGGGGQSRKNGYYDDDDDKYFGSDGGNLSAHQNVPPNPIPGRPLRGERRIPQFRKESVFEGKNYRRRGGDDGSALSSRHSFNNKPLAGEGIKVGSDSREGIFSPDKFDDNDGQKVGFGEDNKSKKDSHSSITEFLRRPSNDDEKDKQDQSDFLEKFKLGDVGKKRNHLDKVRPPLSREEKVEEPPQDADVIFKKMKETGLIPNAVAMLDGLCKDGLIQDAMKLFGLMREKGTMPEVVIYTAVVDGFCQAQKLDDAKRIFKKMQNNGIVPNTFSYTVLIKGLCKGKRLDDAVDYCVEMLEAGHSPNVTTFTVLVDEFCREKGVEEAHKIIETLKQKGFYLDEKAVREHLDKKGPTSPMVWEAIFGPKRSMHRPF